MKFKFNWPTAEKSKLNEFINTLVRRNEEQIIQSLDINGLMSFPCLDDTLSQRVRVEPREMLDWVFSKKVDHDCQVKIWKSIFENAVEDLDDPNILIAVSGKEKDGNESRNVEREKECTSVLGTYHRISSPGLITLYEKPLRRFSLQLAIELHRKEGFTITRDDFYNIHAIAVAKTFYHELFHHLSDMTNQVRSSTQNRGVTMKDHWNFLDEEALAVAISRWHIGENVKATTLIESLLKRAYTYHLTGYKDWIQYKGDRILWNKILEYFAYDNKLLTNKDGTENDAMLRLVQSSWHQLCIQPFAEVEIR